MPKPNHKPSLPLSVWPTAQQPAPRQRAGRYLPSSTAHPAKMLPAIARQAIRAYSQPGDLVLDPMCGIGTTLVEAIHLGRDAIGVELEPRWAELATANTGHARRHGATGTAIVVTGDARQLPHLIDPALAGRVALVLTSPPYGRSLHGQVAARPGRGVAKFDDAYSADPANLGRVNPSALLEALGEILVTCQQLLRPRGVLVLTARPYRHRELLVDLPGQLTEVAEAAGWCCSNATPPCWSDYAMTGWFPAPPSSSSIRSAKPGPAGSPSGSSPTKTSSSFADPQEPRIEDECAACMPQPGSAAAELLQQATLERWATTAQITSTRTLSATLLMRRHRTDDLPITSRSLTLRLDRPDPSWLLTHGANSNQYRRVPPGSSVWVASEVATTLRWQRCACRFGASTIRSQSDAHGSASIKAQGPPDPDPMVTTSGRASARRFPRGGCGGRIRSRRAAARSRPGGRSRASGPGTWLSRAGSQPRR